MKKTVLSGFILVSLLLITILSGCKKEEATNAPSNVGTATLTGSVSAELNLTIDGYEHVPAGTKIVAYIDSKDLVTNPAPGVEYEKIYYETSVNSDGNYTFSNIAAANKEVTVYVYPADFIYFQVQPDNTTRRVVYHFNDFSTMVFKGRSTINDIVY